ncbi:MAG: DUF1552 domain-containing protein [Nannocystis sp.]|nr:DUF1552 domain-containing protein [Nannocystis sp.]MBA3550503.1 DUF1552 domain-containing protein [Nannocystis sp.]
MKRFTLSRRTMLRGAIGGAGVALALPLLEAMLNNNGTALAAGQPLPRRLVTWFFGNGVALKDVANAGAGLRWAPDEMGPAYPLTPQLAPLAPVAEYCSLLTGFDIKAAAAHRRGHHDGVAGFFSGHPFIELPHADNSYSSKFGGPSIDQVAAETIGGLTFLPSVQIAVSKRVIGSEGPTLQFMSHKGPDAALPQIFSPKDLYIKLFASFVPPNDPTKPLRLDALDAVSEDVKRLKLRVGTADRLRLDAHLASVAQIRKQIDALAPECLLPIQPVNENGDFEGKEPLDEVNTIMADLLVEAFKCDITRLASYQYTGSVGYTVFHMLGQSMGHHDMTHDTNLNDSVDAATIHTIEAFAYLLKRLKDTPEGDGNLLDNSCLILGSDAASGYTHDVFDQPCIVAGKGGGALKHPGIHYRSPSKENTSDILLACLQSVVPEATQVGSDIGLSTTPLAQLKA